MEAPIKRNVAKLLMWGAAAWVGYKAVSGLANNKSPEKIIKETVKPVEKAVKEVKKVTKRLLKGSPEAKAHMANLRSKNKTPRGQGKRALKKKAKAGKKIKIEIQRAEGEGNDNYDKHSFSSIDAAEKYMNSLRVPEKGIEKFDVWLNGEKFFRMEHGDDNIRAFINRKKVSSKAEAGKKGGEATADLGKHKGHTSKKGLKQDQAKVSKEEHEKNYQKSIKKKT